MQAQARLVLSRKFGCYFNETGLHALFLQTSQAELSGFDWPVQACSHLLQEGLHVSTPLHFPTRTLLPLQRQE